jgi:hypothetical protein
VTNADKCCASSLLSKSLSVQIAHGDLVVSNSQLLHAPDWIALLLIAVTNILNILDSALIYSSHAVGLHGLSSVMQLFMVVALLCNSPGASGRGCSNLSPVIIQSARFPKFLNIAILLQGLLDFIQEVIIQVVVRNLGCDSESCGMSATV